MVKSNLELTSRTQYLGMLIDTIRERVSSKDFRISVFCDVADKFLLRFPLLARMWQQILGYMAPMEQLISKGGGGLLLPFLGLWNFVFSRPMFMVTFFIPDFSLWLKPILQLVHSSLVIQAVHPRLFCPACSAQPHSLASSLQPVCPRLYPLAHHS